MAKYVIDLDRLEIYEAGAILLTLLACPGAKDAKDTDEVRGGFHQTLCSMALQAQALIDPEWARSPQSIKPLYLLRSDRDIARDLKLLGRRLRDRAVAARMAIAFLKEVETGEPPRLPAGLTRLSINELSKLVLPDSGQRDPENVESRIWRPSRPVIHLAAATQVLMQMTERAIKRQLTFWDVLFNQDVIEWVVTAAKRYERLIGRSTRMHVDPKLLIRVRLATK